MTVQNDDALSRRDFIGATTLGAVALWRGRLPLIDTSLLYVGTYTEGGRRDGIHLLRMNPATGSLLRVATVDAGQNPSFLTIHPNGQTLLAVNEVNETAGKATGSLRSFEIDVDSGELTPINEQASEGAAPCYVSTDRAGRVAMVANYVSGTVSLLPIDEEGTLTSASQVVQHMGTGKITARQEHAHAHCIIPHPSNRFALAADLGVDRVLVYRLDATAPSLTHVESSDALMASGTGPRHLAFHPTLPIVYVAGELNSSVSALRCDPDTGALTQMQTLVMRAAGYSGENFPADIHVARDGRALYVSNRGQNSIAVFSIAPGTGMLTSLQAVSTGGDWPRNFTIDPTGRWLLVANQRSGSITVFRRDVDSGRLMPTPQRIEMASPVCLRFRAQAGPTT
jgi:6-phosphogluconolactonase